jgi:hypothetical protein
MAGALPIAPDEEAAIRRILIVALVVHEQP